MRFVFLLRGKDGFKGLYSEGNPLELCHGFQFSRKQMGVSGLCLETQKVKKPGNALSTFALNTDIQK